MGKTKIYILSLISLVSLSIVLFVGAVYYFAAGLCGEELIKQSPSSGQYVAYLYVRNCGATTNYVTHVNITTKNQVLVPNMNGVINEGEILLKEGKVDVTMTWLSPTNLQLSVVGYDPKNINHQTSYKNTIHINVK